MATISELENLIHVSFKNRPHLLWEALQCAGSPNRSLEGGPLHPEGNKRLALLGDAAATFCVVGQWYPSGQKRGTVLSISSSTPLKAINRHRSAATNEFSVVASDALQTLVSNNNLAKKGKILGLERFMQGSLGLQFFSPDMIATTMEAILGAAYLEGGMRMVTLVMVAMDLGS